MASQLFTLQAWFYFIPKRYKENALRQPDKSNENLYYILLQLFWLGKQNFTSVLLRPLISSSSNGVAQPPCFLTGALYRFIFSRGIRTEFFFFFTFSGYCNFRSRKRIFILSLDVGGEVKKVIHRKYFYPTHGLWRSKKTNSNLYILNLLPNPTQLKNKCRPFL